MRRNAIHHILSTFILLLIAASCSKKHDGSITKDKLLGKWERTFIATDDNRNGILDDTEKREPPYYQQANYYFYADSTYDLRVFNGSTWDSRPGKWWLEGEMLAQKMDTVIFKSKILKLTDIEFILKIGPEDAPTWLGHVRK